MSDIYLSYAEEDRERVQLLAEALREHGWSVFWKREIPSGRTHDELSEDELKTARSVIIVWSKQAIKSELIKAEANTALQREVPIHLILFDKVSLPPEWGAIRAADLSGWDGTADSPDLNKFMEDISANTWSEVCTSRGERIFWESGSGYK